MTANVFSDEQDRSLELIYEARLQMDWVVREDPALEAELNDQDLKGKKVSPKVVNKVLDRIKDL